MAVRELITWLERAKPGMTVLVRTPDGYDEPQPPEPVTALLDGDGVWHEDLGEGAADAGARVSVLVIG